MTLKKFFSKIRANKRGQSSVEYFIIFTVFALVTLVGVARFLPIISGAAGVVFQATASGIDNSDMPAANVASLFFSPQAGIMVYDFINNVGDWLQNGIGNNWMGLIAMLSGAGSSPDGADQAAAQLSSEEIRAQLEQQQADFLATLDPAQAEEIRARMEQSGANQQAFWDNLGITQPTQPEGWGQRTLDGILNMLRSWVNI
ncbi:MAG: hypothetical protein KKD94_06360 [Nanoarchaeota archaeon]|nr:hypothetical protein [Nanoarchaeota archaeon]